MTKGFPVEDVLLLAELGVSDFGESRADEGARKRADVESVVGSALRWHCVGQVQTNKAGRVAQWADVVHSVDRESLVRALAKSAGSRGQHIDVLVQVDIEAADIAEPMAVSTPRPEQDLLQDPKQTKAASGQQRGGCEMAGAPALAHLVAQSANLRLRGVMTVADPRLDAVQVFAALGGVAAQIRGINPAAKVISAGMSGDFREAIAAGATHLRIGSAILGERS